MPTATDQDRRLTILQAASRLWGLSGYHAVPLRRIADEAGVSLALIAHYFGNKHQLFEATVGNLASACDASRQELLAADQDRPFNVVELATRLSAPINQLVQDRHHGHYTLLLWLSHWRDPLPELSVPLARALHPLKESVVDLLQRHWPHKPRAALFSGCCIGFAAAIAFVVDETRRLQLCQQPDEALRHHPAINPATRFIEAAIRAVPDESPAAVPA